MANRNTIQWVRSKQQKKGECSVSNNVIVFLVLIFVHGNGGGEYNEREDTMTKDRFVLDWKDKNNEIVCIDNDKGLIPFDLFLFVFCFSFLLFKIFYLFFLGVEQCTQ